MDLVVKDLTITVAKRPLLRNLSFSATAGQMLGIIGPSGCGKTTLLNSLGLLLAAHSGNICYNGSDARTWKRSQIAKFWKNTASFVIQDAGIDEDENVLYNVTLKKQVFFSSRKTDPAAKAALEQVGLFSRAHDSARVLSGGEQRRVAIARAIYRQVQIIFADEPTASLDEDNRLLVQNLLLQEARRGALVIISTHDQELAQVCDALIELPKNPALFTAD